ncbi:hypothetical protein SCP_1701690 [Sparassis crispa]|uniref:Uncharacterized protein n=1 Tax=Sparassis crispa TaxID=139825 RepID=A0A401H600_9APHY|nr:hypothetical protein SCP_1701690 [Sparassis crispa]GBE89844.1 hypothetical protein SCP_1701690 [Sparassis crispa]
MVLAAASSKEELEVNKIAGGKDFALFSVLLTPSLVGWLVLEEGHSTDVPVYVGKSAGGPDDAAVRPLHGTSRSPQAAST